MPDASEWKRKTRCGDAGPIEEFPHHHAAGRTAKVFLYNNVRASQPLFIAFEERETIAIFYCPLAVMERSSTTLALSSAIFSALVGKTITPDVSPSSDTLLKYRISPYFSKMASA
jgi:hypothetical protein